MGRLGDGKRKKNKFQANIKLSKTQLHKIGQSVGFFDKLLRPLLKTGFSLIRTTLKPLAKSVLIPIELMAATSATDAAIHKRLFGSGLITLIISNKDMNDIMKIVRYLEESGLLIKGVSETIEDEANKQKGGFLSMSLETLGASLLGNLLTGKGAIATSQGQGIIRTSEGTIAAGGNF